jgi:3-oxoacyl-[acyl-carrier protein] reductase
VAVLDIRKEHAHRVAAAIGGDNILALRADVSLRRDIEAAVQMILEKFGAPDIVINNAGYTHTNKPLLDVDESTFDRIFNVNVKAIYHMVQTAVPLMLKGNGGVIINIGSTAGIRPRPGLTWYNASKGAVNVLSKSLAVELAPRIRVNAICPVMGETGMLASFMGVADTPENRARFVSTIPMGRFCRPADVAEAALYLATSEFITGIELPVDGGRTI